MLEILYQDDDLVVINKPSGLLVHRSPIDKRETRFAVQQLRDQVGQHVSPIHRLDKPTSGVLVFGLNSDITQRVQADWDNVDKSYLALTRGKLHSQTLNHPVRTLSELGVERIQDAETAFALLKTTTLPVTFGTQADQYTHTTFSLVEAKPKTGRQHQIRKHLKHLNHPIVGDTRYGKGDINRYFREQHDAHRLMLHCQRITLTHPVSGVRLMLEAKPDNTWTSLISILHL